MTTRPTPSNRDADQLIADRLDAHARRLDIAARPVAEVMARGRHRQQRRRTAVGLATVAGIAGGAVASVAVLTRPPEQMVSGDDPSSSAAPTDTPTDTPTETVVVTVPASAYVEPIELVESNLVWNVVEPGTAEALGATSFSGSGIVGDGPYLAWSTSPGLTNDYQPTLWRSDDGQHWGLAPEPPPVSPAGLAAFGDRFLAFGTMPSAAATAGQAIEAAVALSDDAGGSWRTVDLPLDLSSLLDDPTVVSVGTSAAAIAAGDQGVLLAVRPSVNLDWQNILPTDVFENTWYWQAADGVHVEAVDPCATPTDMVGVATTVMSGGNAPIGTVAVPPATAGPSATSTTEISTAAAASLPLSSETTAPGGACTDSLQPARFLSWDELGVAPATVAALTGKPRFFLSSDGESFEEVAAPATADGTMIGDVKLVEYAGGFAAWTLQYEVSGDATIGELHVSPDGRTWSDLGETPVLYVEALAAMGDRLVLWGSGVDGMIVAVRDSSGVWTTTNLDGVLRPEDGARARFFASTAAVGPTGITIAGSIFKDPVAEAGGVETSRDGITVRAADSNGNYTFSNTTTGEELGSMTNGSEPSGLVAYTADGTGFEVRLVDDGPVVATFSWEDFNNLLSSASGVVEPPEGIVLHSTDGTRWSRESLDDIAGESVTASRSREAGSQVIVAVNRRGSTDGTSVPEQLLLIGTPAG